MKRAYMLLAALLLAPLAALHASDAPVLLSPVNGMELTDVATYFQWLPVKDCTDFEIQIARDAAFADLVKTKRTANKGFHKNLYFPKDILPPGAFWWRVRALAGSQPGPWSEARAMKVNADHPVLPHVVRSIAPEHPLFLMRSRAWNPLKCSEHVGDIIPPGLGQVIVVDDIALASQDAFERAKRYQELGVDFVVWNNRCQVSLATLEVLFQRYSHCIGTAEGEHFDGLMWERGPEGNLAESDFVHRAWMLCGKYGRFYFFADGDAGSYRWPSFVQRDREYFEKYRRNIVPMFKTTKGDLALHSYGAVQGLMVSGLADNCGTWVDEWIWPGCGFTQLGEVLPEEQRWANRRKVGTKQCPWTYDIQMWLMGIVSGSTVFHLESAHQWTPEGKAANNYTRFFLPFINAVVAHNLIPSRTAYLDRVRLAVNPDLERTKGKHQKQYAGGYAFLRDLYAVKAPGDQELIPNNSRYGIVCLLPPDTTQLAGHTRVLAQRDLLDPARARAVFDAAYPERFRGDAFMWECDGTVIVTDSNENQDSPQTFAMPFDRGLLRCLSGTIGVHEYIIGKNAGDGFWFQVNGEYPDRDMTISLACSRRPEVIVEPPSASLKSDWHEETRTLSLRLSHSAGAVEVTVK